MEQEQIDLMHNRKIIESAINIINSNWQELVSNDLKRLKEILQEPISDSYIEKVTNNDTTINLIVKELEKIKALFND
jgi:hypothetical protein